MLTRCNQLLFLPLLFLINIAVPVVYAQSTDQSLDQSLESFSLVSVVELIIKVLYSVLVPLGISTLFLMFVYGVVVYIRMASKGDGQMVKVAKTRLLYGFIIVFVTFSLWTFVYFLRSIFSA